VKIGRDVFPEICSQTDTQTHIHAQRQTCSTQYCIPIGLPRGGVMILKLQRWLRLTAGMRRHGSFTEWLGHSVGRWCAVYYKQSFNRHARSCAVVAYNSGATTQQCNQRVVGRDQHGSLTVPSTITQSSDDDDDDVFCVHRTTTSRVVDDLIAFVHDE